MADPEQDLLLAALSESGIFPSDLDSDLPEPNLPSQDSTVMGGSELLDHIVGSTLLLGPAAPSAPPPATHALLTARPPQSPRPALTTMAFTRGIITPSRAPQPSRPAMAPFTLPQLAGAQLRPTATPAQAQNKVRLKDLLHLNSLSELLKLKPPPGVTAPVAAATVEPTNGMLKKEGPVSVGMGAATGKEAVATRVWATEELKIRSFSPTVQVSVKDEEEVEEEEEELGHTETYAEYMPLKLRIGLRHPDAVVETSSLSSVTPPDIWYRLSIPEETVDSGWLSALQLEAITYGCQQQETYLTNGERAGFLIGDGAGVGKGRTIAGIIYENYLLGRKRAVWFSVSNDLKYDAERDLKDIGAKNITVHSLSKFKYGKITSKENGAVKKGVVFATYSALIGESQSGGKYRTRIKQLLHWCSDDFDGVIIFDECHKAKNLCPVGSSKPTKTGLAVLELQNRLPKARVIYASATGASEPRNMAYMNRLGIWGEGTPFREFNDFIQAVERRGVGAMEIVAMDMKLRGMYIARQLSFSGVTFKIEEIPLDSKYISMYNRAVHLWVEAREKFQMAAELIDAEQRMKKSMWGQFWSSHQRFFKYLCIASKVRRLVQLAREEVKNGKCVVIGLQSTGEARTLEALEEGGGELNDFVSTAKGVFQCLIEKHFPAPDRKKLSSLLGFELGSLSGGGAQPARSNAATTTPAQKRKAKSQDARGQVKRARAGRSESESSSSEEEEDEEDEGGGRDSASSFESVSSGDDDFNPFRDESDDEGDPWLVRKERRKKSVEKEEERKRKSKKSKGSKRNADIDPDSIQSALLASGLGLRKSSFSSAGAVRVPHSHNPAPRGPPPLAGTPPAGDAVERAQAMKRELLDHLEQLADALPPNTLDELIDELGGTDNVAEMTGRKGRVVSNDDGSIAYESRSELDVPVEILNVTEKKRFMDGDKNIAIISEAASSGISLQADRRAKNQRRRVHMTLELPWSADRAIQQFGRTHRSNQVNAPEYLFLISELAGEQRFASIVAKRLESLGALTHGDRRATESRDLSRYNFDNKYGRQALEMVMKSIVGLDAPLVPPPSDYCGDFFRDILKGLVGVGMVNIDERMGLPTLDKDYNNIGKFLNRILGMEVAQQNSLFQYFSDTLQAVIVNAKRAGRYDMGILDLGSGEERVKKLEVKRFNTRGHSGAGHVEMYTVLVERGMSWEEATEVWADQSGPDDGFYLSLQVRNGKRTAVLAREVSTRKRLFLIYRPNTGKQLRHEMYADLKKKYKKVSSDDAMPHWEEQFNTSKDTCTHAYWRGNCKKAALGMVCEVGLRCRTYHVLCGSVLSVWSRVEGVMTSVSGSHLKMQIVRLRTEDGQRIVGLIIPQSCVPLLACVLASVEQQQQQAAPGSLPSHALTPAHT
uniref:Protein strawberry notch homolog 1 n=2 Tax=Petromyzon marinus TaxID=7757 RepID=A0AAJ7SRJ1_PETMA|nr:protein strawberry notch homolog 1 [Petromyzon marinus]